MCPDDALLYFVIISHNLDSTRDPDSGECVDFLGMLILICRPCIYQLQPETIMSFFCTLLCIHTFSHLFMLLSSHMVC